jgi:hypothetical protein
MSVSGNNNTNGTLLIKPTDRLMGKNRLVLHSILINMMKWNRYLHFFQFLHFTDNRGGDDTKEGNCDRPWEIQNIFQILNRTFSRFHNPSENMATDEVQRNDILRKYIPKKHKRFCTKLHKLHNWIHKSMLQQRTGRAG